jgi:GntR family transcriptional regulator
MYLYSRSWQYESYKPMEASAPLYAKLKEFVVRDISSGVLHPADKLPSQRELCIKFKVSHMTVRRAINELVNEGVIYAIPGKGLYVAEKKYPAETTMLGFTGEMNQRGLYTTSRILDKGLVPASTVIARALNIEPGTEMAYLYRLRLVNNMAICLQHSYLVHQRCPGILDYMQEDISLYAVLRDIYHIHLVNSITTAEAVLAQKNQAELLGLGLPLALLVIEQINTLENNQAVEYSRLAYRGDKYVMQTRLQLL